MRRNIFFGVNADYYYENKGKNMHRQVIINVEESNIRVAFLEDNELAELFIEQINDKTIVGNIYYGIVEDVVPGIKAAFIDIGLEKRAFLHFDDFCKESLLSTIENKPAVQADSANQNIHGRHHYSNDPQNILKRGMPIIVQVIKDEIGQKSARVTSFISIPGRYLVLLPFQRMEGGISKKINDREERQRLKKILRSFRTKQMSFIVRTAGYEQGEENLKKDVRFLKNEWARVIRSFKKFKKPCLIYNDHDIFYRLIRDIFTSEINEIIVDSQTTLEQIRRILRLMIPELKDIPKLYKLHKNIFDTYDIEKQIQKAAKRKVWLKSGGFIVFDEMEALTAIDINTGRYIGTSDQEKTILKTNLEAAKLIAHHIRLRDIGGLIVVDFIDMIDRENKELIEKEFRKWLKNDRAKMAVSNLSDFGLIEMTRRRVRESLRNMIFIDCPYCDGSGSILNSNEIWRKIKYDVIEKIMEEPAPAIVSVVMHPLVKKYISENFQDILGKIGNKQKVKIEILESDDMHIEQFEVKVFEKPKAPLKLRFRNQNHN